MDFWILPNMISSQKQFHSVIAARELPKLKENSKVRFGNHVGCILKMVKFGSVIILGVMVPNIGVM